MGFLQRILDYFARRLTVPAPAPAPSPMPRPINPAATPGRYANIIATEFGGAGDEQPSAYADVKPGWPNRPGVALPYRFIGARPPVRVWRNSKSVDCDIVDVGPHHTSDAYWLQNRRPLAEDEMRQGKGNGAGIDLTPPVMTALGVPGKPGTRTTVLSWEFVGATPAQPKPVPPSAPAATGAPPWLLEAGKDLGFHETGNNRGLEAFIRDGHCGQQGDPWCSISACAWLERAGIPSPRSASSQSFRSHPNFMRLLGPALGAIAVYWRGSPTSGIGHVGFYLGETATQVLTRGGNESDAVRDQFEPKARLFGFWWPKSVPLPKIGPIRVKDADGHPAGSET
jgi:hypothetical protein